MIDDPLDQLLAAIERGDLNDAQGNRPGVWTHGWGVTIGFALPPSWQLGSEIKVVEQLKWDQLRRRFAAPKIPPQPERRKEYLRRKAA